MFHLEMNSKFAYFDFTCICAEGQICIILEKSIKTIWISVKLVNYLLLTSSKEILKGHGNHIPCIRLQHVSKSARGETWRFSYAHQTKLQLFHGPLSDAEGATPLKRT